MQVVYTNVAIRTPGAARAIVDVLPLPPGTSMMLASGTYRLELTKLNRRLKLGDRVGLFVTIEAMDGTRREIPVSAEVRRRSPTDDHRISHRH